MQLPPAGGASPEIVVGQAQGLSLFVSAGASALNHHNNRFEDGYEAQLPTVTVGADYWITPRLLAGVAFNYTNFDGTYDDGGGFDKDIFSPLLYATFLPFDRAFVNAVLGYARNENSNDRKVVCLHSDEPTGDPFTGHTSADYSENQYSAELQAGYDHPIGNFTIGPRLGFAFGYSQVDSFKEKGNTGLELRYSGLNQTSVQTQPRRGGDRRHRDPERRAAAAGERRLGARVRQRRAQHRCPLRRGVPAVRNSPSSASGRRATGRTSRVGVSASFVNGMQPFVQFVTVQGNDNFVSYGGTAGLRFSF